MAYTREAALCWLASGGLSPGESQALLTYEPEAEKLLVEWPRISCQLPISEKIRKGLDSGRTEDRLDNWQKQIEKSGIRVITFMDRSYPERLRPLADAPSILFVKGTISSLEGRTAAVVGSRNASWKGLDATHRIAEELSRNGIRIISGLASGIDTAAHEGCLRGGSPTAAVLGCGLDRVYPAENSRLADEIIANGGVLVSEYAPGERPLGWHFPFRNRIISGLGDCLVLMEARIKSGSMTSVRHALEQGREVFAYPGDPIAPGCEGNRMLIREGAVYFTCAEDLMEDMKWLDKGAVLGQNMPGVPEEDATLSLGEKQVLMALGKGERSFDQLCMDLGFSAAQLNVIISMLQIQGYIRVLPGKIYARAQI